jgi:hypothetical protein
MFGVVPNWLDDKSGKKNVTKEKLIVDHLIKNIGKSVSGNGSNQVGYEDTDDCDKNEKKKKLKNKDRSLFQTLFGWILRDGERNNKSFQDRLVISVENSVYQAWKIIVIFICIISSYIYAYIAAFGIPYKEEQPRFFLVIVVFEVIFGMDIAVQFLLEYKPEDQYNKVRDLTEIAKRYLKSRFFIDALAMIPFHEFFDVQ